MERKSSTVKSFARSSEFVGWWVLELERQENPRFLVHHNWVAHNGALKPGDEVIAEGTTLHYRNSELPCALRLERAPKPALIAE